MSRRAQLYTLGALLVILAATVVSNLGDGAQIFLPGAAPGKFQPLAVENPSLRLDLLEKIRREYPGTTIDIFTGRPVRKAQPPAPEKAQIEKPLPPPEPELVVPYRFFGYSIDPRTNRRKAFFTNGDDVFIVGEGETLQNRFRVLRLGNTTADLEELSSGKRKTLQLEQPPGAG
jgi:hypothetical protein